MPGLDPIFKVGFKSENIIGGDYSLHLDETPFEDLAKFEEKAVVYDVAHSVSGVPRRQH